MLRFAQKTDGAFAAIVENSLELALDMMGDESNAREYGIYNDTAQWFGGERLIRAADKLLEAHRGEKVYAPNDYHFFLLHKVISFYVDSHNDAIATEGKPQDVRSFLIGKIDYEAIQNIFFWDADYEISPEKYSSLTREEKERFRFEDTLFGVINRLMPSDEDLELEETHKIGGEAPSYYIRGEDYPHVPVE